MLRARALAVILALTGVVGPALPPMHVHDVTDGQGHDAVVEHRHLALHVPEAPAIPGHPEVRDHHDGLPLTIDQPSQLASRVVLAVPDLPVERAFPEPGVARTARAARDRTARLTHGPPHRPRSLRAPPAVLSL